MRDKGALVKAEHCRQEDGNKAKENPRGITEFLVQCCPGELSVKMEHPIPASVTSHTGCRGLKRGQEVLAKKPTCSLVDNLSLGL